MPGLAPIPEHRDAQAAQVVGQLVGLGHVLDRGRLRQVDRLGDPVVRVPLEGRLHPDVPLRRDLVGGDEHLADVFRHPGQAVQRPLLGHLLHQLRGVEPPPLRHRLEVGIREREVPVAHDVAEGDGEERFDPGGAAGDDADRPRGGDGRHRGIPDRLALAIGASSPVGERAPLLRQAGRLIPADRGDELHHLVAQLQRRLAVVGDAELDQEVGPPHHPQADPAVGVDLLHDLVQRIRVHLDHVVQEPDREAHHALQLVPGDGSRGVIGPSELVQVDGAQVARVIGCQWLLAAGVGGLDRLQLRHRVGGAAVHPVDEDEPGVPGAPGRVHDPVEDLARPEPARGLPGMGVNQVVLAVRYQGLHERVRGGHRDVEVRDPPIQLALDELQDVRVVHLEDAHVGAPPGAPLLHRLGGSVEDAQEADRAAGLPARGTHQGVLGAEPGEGETGAATALVDDGCPLHRLEDLVHGVPDGEHETGRVLEAVVLPGVHQGRGIRQEVAVHHQLVELTGDVVDLFLSLAPGGLGGGDRHGHAPAHIFRGLGDVSGRGRLAGGRLPEPVQVPFSHDSKRGLGPLALLQWAAELCH